MYGSGGISMFDGLRRPMIDPQGSCQGATFRNSRLLQRLSSNADCLAYSTFNFELISELDEAFIIIESEVDLRSIAR